MDYKKAISGCARNATVVVLAHQPNAAAIMLADRVAAAKMDLILSGYLQLSSFASYLRHFLRYNSLLYVVGGIFFSSISSNYCFLECLSEVSKKETFTFQIR